MSHTPGTYWPADGAYPNDPTVTSQPDLATPGYKGVTSGPPGAPWAQPNAAVSRYAPGCGHRITRYDIRQEEADAGLGETEPAKVLCCPVCGYVQRRMPLSQYLNQWTTPLVVG